MLGVAIGFVAGHLVTRYWESIVLATTRVEKRRRTRL